MLVTPLPILDTEYPAFCPIGNKVVCVRVSSASDCSDVRLTMMWRQGLLYASHARREPTHLEQVGFLCCREVDQGRQSCHCGLLEDAVKLGQDGDGGSHVQNVTVGCGVIRGPEPVYTPYCVCACRWPGKAFELADASRAA
jgi:hypothetical protein